MIAVASLLVSAVCLYASYRALGHADRISELLVALSAVQRDNADAQNRNNSLVSAAFSQVGRELDELRGSRS